MENYFILNKETGKIELHFAKETYMALTAEQKSAVKSNFLWGRSSGRWISRCKWPNTSTAERCAASLGLENAGETGERLTFAEQMERKAERAENRADRYENRADAAEKRGEALQKPINDMHGDIAFFTQPNINSSAGRAFTSRRERMWASFEKGFSEFNKSAYWQDRAKTARRTAEQKELKDRAFLDRRIRERESDIRKLTKSIESWEGYAATIDKGQIPRDEHGWEVKRNKEQILSQVETWTERLEAKLDELGFYQDCLEQLGGIGFSRENVKPGYLVKVQRWGVVEVLSTGPKNFTAKEYGWPMQYAEIIEIVKEQAAKPEAHPFTVGMEFTCHRWNGALGAHGNTEKITARIIRATDKSVTLQVGEEKPYLRKPYKVKWGNDDGRKWGLQVTDWNDGIFYQIAE